MSGRVVGALRRVGLSLLGPAIAVVVALVISAIVIALIGEDPVEALRVMFNLGDTPAAEVQSIVVILNRAIPLFLSGLAVSIAFRMGLFNIGRRGAVPARHAAWRPRPAGPSSCRRRCTCCSSSSSRWPSARGGPGSPPSSR